MDWIVRIAGVRPAEGRRTLMASLFYFFFVAHVVMVKSASNALFLSRHDPKDLPYLYIAMAILVAVVAVFAAKVLADPRRRLLRLLSLSIVGGLYLIFWLILYLDLAPVSPAVYLFGEVAVTALNIQFWSVAGDIFDPQEGKRVFSILAGGGMSGSIFGGLLVHWASPSLGAVNLLLLATGALAVCMVCAQALTKHHGRADDLPKQDNPSLRRGFGYVLKDPYPRTFAGLMLLGMVITAFVDYFFRTSAHAHFPSEDQLAVLFGDLNLYVGLISVLFLFLFSNRILRRVGIFYYLLVVPAGLAATAVISIFLPVFLVIYGMKIIENSGSLSINQAGQQLLFNPIPTGLRAPARGVIDGLARKLGYAVGGGVLLLLRPWLTNANTQAALVLIMVLAYAGLLLRLRILYVRSLDRKLRVGAAAPVHLRLDDAHTRRALIRALESRDPELILTALRLLASAPSEDLSAQLTRLIHHEDERVRIAAMDAGAKRGHKELLFDLLSIIHEGTRRSRVAAIRAIVALDPQQASGALAPYLRAEDPGLLTAAIEALLTLRGAAPDNPAVAVLEGLLDRAHQASPAERRETAKLLGRLGEGRYAGHLSTYLNDPEPSVRRLAAQSCKRVYRNTFVPHLLGMLADREIRHAARDALAAYGDRVVDKLEQWLNDRERPLAVRIRLPRVLRSIGTQRAGEALLFSNPQDDASLRHRIALALSGVRLQHPEVRFDRKWALEAVDRRVESYSYYAQLYEAMARHLPEDALVRTVLAQRLEQNIETAFRVLGLIYPHRTIMSIHHRFRSTKRENISDALELLDNVIDRESRERLLPLLENHKDLLATPPQAEQGLGAVENEMAELCGSRDNLLSSAAIHTCWKLGRDLRDRAPIYFDGVDTMDVMERVLFLESVDIFKQNNLDDLSALAAIARERRFRKGDFILREGEPGDALYIITSGEVEIHRGTRKLLSLGEKASLGGISLLDQKPHAASAICVSPCECLVISRTDFMDLLSDRVELLHGIFLALTDRLRALLAVTDGGGLKGGECFEDGPTNPT